LLNNQEIAGENGSYYEVKNGGILEMGQEYSALLTRSDDGKAILTCPLVATLHDEVSLYPTIVGTGGTFFLSTAQPAQVTVYDHTGRETRSLLLPAGAAQAITVRESAGLYLLRVSLSSGDVRTFKIMVEE